MTGSYLCFFSEFYVRYCGFLHYRRQVVEDFDAIHIRNLTSSLLLYEHQRSNEVKTSPLGRGMFSFPHARESIELIRDKPCQISQNLTSPAKSHLEMGWLEPLY